MLKKHSSHIDRPVCSSLLRFAGSDDALTTRESCIGSPTIEPEVSQIAEACLMDRKIFIMH